MEHEPLYAFRCFAYQIVENRLQRLMVIAHFKVLAINVIMESFTCKYKRKCLFLKDYNFNNIETTFTSVCVKILLTFSCLVLDVRHFSLEFSALSWSLPQENEIDPYFGAFTILSSDL